MEIDDNETSTAFSSSSTGDSVVDSSINNNSSSKNRARPITAPVAVAVSSSNGSVGNNPPLRAIHTAPHPQSSTNNNNNEQNVRVVARVRPLSNKEITEKSSESIVAYSKQSTIRVHSSSHGDFTNSNDNNIDKRNFEFDSVFGPNSTQEQVYEGTCGDMINSSIFKGFNATILAYGQTGSGKVRQHSLFFVRFERDTLLLTNLLYITFSLSLDLLDVYNGHRWQYRKYQSKERRLGHVNNNETTISIGWDNCPCRL